MATGTGAATVGVASVDAADGDLDTDSAVQTEGETPSASDSAVDGESSTDATDTGSGAAASSGDDTSVSPATSSSCISRLPTGDETCASASADVGIAYASVDVSAYHNNTPPVTNRITIQAGASADTRGPSAGVCASYDRWDGGTVHLCF